VQRKHPQELTDITVERVARPRPGGQPGLPVARRDIRRTISGKPRRRALWLRYGTGASGTPLAPVPPGEPVPGVTT
jgi:hypothetical protein